MTLDFSKARIAVVGDAIRDRWIHGHADRVSPEGPWLVHVEDRIEEKDGGAANCAANCKSLGAHTELFALPRVLWPIKTRYVASGHQILRADRERIEPIDPAIERSILSGVKAFDPQIIVISDYAKGVCTPSLCQALIKWGREHGVKTIVDPKGADWHKYAGCGIITPNRAELHATSKLWKIDPGFGAVLLTKGAEGMELTSMVHNLQIPAAAREVFDVVGAGDTVVAALACCLAIGIDLPEAARIANAAAGVVVGKAGTATCSIEELEAAL